MEETGLISLYDYLGYAAGAQLGKEVATVAVEQKEKIGKKAIATRTYTGEILMYRREFLDEYFNRELKNIIKVDPSEITISISDQQDYDLPF